MNQTSSTFTAVPPFMIEAEHLTKIYRRFLAIEDVSFKIGQGEITAFLGPNGAGKSTTMKILCGFLLPTSGTARIAGFDMSSQRLQGASRLGYLPENGPLYPDMTPISLLRFFADVRRIPAGERKERIEETVFLCDLGDVVGKPIGKLSKGYKQRVGMAQVLLGRPDVLILDEPTSGLDPNQVHQFRETILKIGKTKTVLISTHILQEVEAVASRILFMNEGRLVFDGSVADFRGSASSLDIRFQEISASAAD